MKNGRYGTGARPILLIVAGIIIKKRGIVTEHINKEVSSLVINVLFTSFYIVIYGF